MYMTAADNVLKGLGAEVRTHCECVYTIVDPSFDMEIYNMDVDDVKQLLVEKFGRDRIGHKMFFLYVGMYMWFQRSYTVDFDALKDSVAGQVLFWNGYKACEAAGDKDDNLMLDVPLSAKKKWFEKSTDDTM